MGKIIETSEKEGIKLEEYKGTYSLVRQREWNGEWYSTWCKIIFGKDKLADKASPVKLILGDKVQAVQVLEDLINELTGKFDKQGDGAF